MLYTAQNYEYSAGNAETIRERHCTHWVPIKTHNIQDHFKLRYYITFSSRTAK
jgi:hypothetical protein